ncbi:MAG: hypothetical protein JOZ69_14460 [Myxococcales bacterium]|nr:hypothetical protein [Myxococcales bacterium]
MLTRRVAAVVAALNVVTAGLIAFGVFVALPARWWPVDSVALALVVLELSSAAGLLGRARWAEALARASALVLAAVGLATVTALALTASWLSGVYGPVGRGAGIVLSLVAVLVLPYLVLIPVAELLWLGPPERTRGAAGGAVARR